MNNNHTARKRARRGDRCGFSRKPALQAAAVFFILTCGIRGAYSQDSGPAPGNDAAGRMREFFQGAETRLPGSAGNLAIEEKVAGLFAGSGFEHGEMKYTAPSFVPGRTEMSLGTGDGGKRIRLYPMHPSLFRPGNFKESSFDAPLIYAGRGGIEELKALAGKEIAGALLAMEFDSGSEWTRFLQFNPKGFVFLGGANLTRFDALSKVYASETAVPRFYIESGDADSLRDMLKNGAAPVASVSAEPSRWENRVLRNLWVLAPGRDENMAREVCVVVARMDSNCIVPEMAYGAQAGANLFLLLEMLRDFKSNPPERSVMLVAVNAHTQGFLGERMLAWHLLTGQTSKVRDILNKDRREQELLAGYYSSLFLADPAADDNAFAEAFVGFFAQRPEAGARLRERLAESMAKDLAAEEKGVTTKYGGKSVFPGVQTCRRLAEAIGAGDLAEAISGLDPDELKALRAYVAAADEAVLIEWRTLTDDSTGRNLTIKDPIVNLAKGDVNRIKQRILDIAIAGDSAGPDAAAAISELKAARDRHVNILTLFNRVGFKTALSDLSVEEIGLLRGYVAGIIRRQTRYAELNTATRDADSDNDGIRGALMGRRTPFVMMLDLDWNSDQVGFSTGNAKGEWRWSIRLGNNLRRIVEQAADIPCAGMFIDTLTMQGGLNESFFTRHQPALEFFHVAGRTPAFGMQNAFSEEGRSFLPTDTIDALDAGRVEKIMGFATGMFRAMMADTGLTSASDLALDARYGVPPDMAPAWSLRIKTFKFDELASTSVLPDNPVENTAVILRRRTQTPPPIANEAIAAGDAIDAFISMGDERASTVFYGLSRPGYVSSAFRFDPDFMAPDHTIDAGEMNAKVSSDVSRAAERHFVMFACEEFPITPMADPSTVSARSILIRDIIPLRASGNSTPRRYGVTGIPSVMSQKGVNLSAGGPAAFYSDGKDKIKLITNNKRLLLNASEKYPEGEGFDSPAAWGGDVLSYMARDMAVVNLHRLRKLRDVANELAREFMERGKKSYDAMLEAKREGRHLDYLLSLYDALGSQVKAYEQTKGTIDDMLKAVVVYMALLLPFCFFVQKLVFNFVKIEAQMAAFAVLFVLTYIVFRTIHPAFRVAQAPEAIFIAFVMGSLGLFVIFILRGRFEGETQLLFRAQMGSGASDVAYASVGQKAILIGVQNMKRRRMRTMLTTATIVIIAFTMLSFTSVSRRMNPTVVSRTKNVPYTGIMFNWPGKAVMDDGTLRVFEAMFEGHGKSIVRRWMLPSDDTTPFHVACSTGAAGRFDAALGLSVEEDGFLGHIPMLSGRFFEDDNAEEALLFGSSAAAFTINLEDPGSAHVVFRGRKLKVAGVIDETRFRMMRDLNDAPLMPIKSVIKDAVQTTESDVSDEFLDVEGAYFYTDTSSLLVLPAGLAENMGARPYSVSLKMADSAPVWPMMEKLLFATQAKFHMSSLLPFKIGAGEDESRKTTVAPGVYYIGSNYSTAVGGLAVLIIPLLIASTIILNTMLGAVYERKNEIAVYNAVGLNPHHIGMFFLAESLVYGVLGAVGGYLIGQVLSIVLNAAGLVSDINLNYSSLSVAYVILFTIAVVLLSTLYPAVVATKSAVPSGKRTWSLPDNDGQTMNITFPFIYQPSVASGIMAYVERYFSRFSEASIGNLIAVMKNARRVYDEKGRAVFEMNYELALAPYDLGVTQTATLILAFDYHIEAYRLRMKLDRISGQDTNWVSTNRPFLEQLRKHLMHWRNISSEEHRSYVSQADKLFDGRYENGPTI